jgi:hypothetical protein
VTTLAAVEHGSLSESYTRTRSETSALARALVINIIISIPKSDPEVTGAYYELDVVKEGD